MYVPVPVLMRVQSELIFLSDCFLMRKREKKEHKDL
jgi:hypothetical protein